MGTGTVAAMHLSRIKADLCHGAGPLFEPSTNGNGVHGYFVIHKAGVHPKW